jgi:hypothetical protein
MYGGQCSRPRGADESGSPTHRSAIAETSRHDQHHGCTSPGGPDTTCLCPRCRAALRDQRSSAVRLGEARRGLSAVRRRPREANTHAPELGLLGLDPSCSTRVRGAAAVRRGRSSRRDRAHVRGSGPGEKGTGAGTGAADRGFAAAAPDAATAPRARPCSARSRAGGRWRRAGHVLRGAGVASAGQTRGPTPTTAKPPRDAGLEVALVELAGRAAPCATARIPFGTPSFSVAENQLCRARLAPPSW